jgi:hypothetical protein
VAEDDRVGGGEAPAQTREAPARRAAVVDHRDPRRPGLDEPRGGKLGAHL